MDNTTQSYLLNLHEASHQGRLVVFVGSGVSANSGVPTWKELIDALKNDLPQGLSSEKDDLKIAQIYKDTYGYKDYFKKIRDVLKDGRVACNPIHHAILELDPVHIITTNYDDLIEQAIQIDYKQYDVISKDNDLPYYRFPNKLVKMHGDFKTGNIILAEEDYYNYATNFPLIRSFVTSLFTTNIVLFVGFSFSDLNLKVILNDLKNILNKDMQRVYLLLSDATIDKETIRYYEQKGINIVNIANASEYVDTLKININDLELAKIKSEKGKILYQQLKIIKQFEEIASDNIVSLLYHSLKSIQQELTMLGDGIKYVFPAKERPYWNYYSSGLQICSKSFEITAQELKTHKGRRSFVLKHPKKERDFLKKQAMLQGILNIDDFQVLTEYDRNHCGENLCEYKTVDDFYDLDFNSVISQINSLSRIGLYYDKRDLILPYLLCRVGRFYDAYELYKTRITEFWKKELYVLYFISLYNMYHIRYQLQSELWDRPDIDTDGIVEDIGAFDLETLLNRMPIPNAIKLTLRDLFYNRIFSENAKEVMVLASKLHKQKKQSELGGASQNSNVPNLTSKFWRVFEFCIRNCIEYNNSFFGVLATDTIVGILNSHATKDNKIAGFISASKIDELRSSDIRVIISFIDTKDLHDIFVQYDIKKITLDNDAVIYLNTIIDNLYASMFGKNIFNEDQKIMLPFNVYHIFFILGNIILVLDKITNEIDKEIVDKIFKITHSYSELLYESTNVKHLHGVIKRYPPSDQMALCLIKDCLHRNNHETRGIISSLSLQLSSTEIVIEEDVDFKQLVSEDGKTGLAMYKILPQSVQKKYLDYMFTHCKKLIDYLQIMDRTQTIPSDTTTIQTLLNNYKTDNNVLAVFYYLSVLRKNEIFANLHKAFDKFGKNYVVYKFLKSPMAFKNIDAIEPSWLQCCSNEEIQTLLKHESLRKKTKEYIQTDPTGKLVYNKIYSLL